MAERRIDRAETNPKAPALMIPHKRSLTGKITPLSSESGSAVKAPGWLAKRVMKIPQYSGRGYIDYEGRPKGRFPLLPGHGGALALWLTFVVAGDDAQLGIVGRCLLP
jgi:hypothetical protein